MGALADILVSKGGYNKTDALNAEKGPRAAELAKEFGVSLGGDSNLSATDQLTQSVSNTINSLWDQWNQAGAPSLTDAEMTNFLNKAIEQVTPYYDKKKVEIEKGIKEGKIQSMEDILLNIRDVEENTKQLLANYDISQAQTTEELANKLADITASKGEDLTLKADDWKNRIEQNKMAQVKGDTLTSGVGRKQIQDLLARQATEQGIVERKAGVETTVAQTGAKYDLQRVALARQNAEQERVNKIGTPSQKAELEAKAAAELGLTDPSQLGSSAEVLRARADRNITTYKPGALTTSEEERKKAIESRKLQLQNEELAARTAKEAAQRQSIQAKISQQNNRLLSFTG